MTIFKVPTQQDLTDVLVFCGEDDTHENRCKLHFGLVSHTKCILDRDWGMYANFSVKDQVFCGIIISDMLEAYQDNMASYHFNFAESKGWDTLIKMQAE